VKTDDGEQRSENGSQRAEKKLKRLQDCTITKLKDYKIGKIEKKQITY